MRQYVTYEPENQVVSIDFSGLTLTQEILDTIVAEVRELTTTLPGKVCAIARWKNVKIPPETGNEKVGQALAELLNYVPGFFRYEVAEDTPFRIVETVSYSRVFPSKPVSKAAALAGVRAYEATHPDGF